MQTRASSNLHRVGIGLRGGLMSLLLAACGGGGVAIGSEPLAGTVGGQPWAFVSGETDAFLSEGEGDFFAAFYAADVIPCGFAPPGGDQLLLSVPKEPGEFDFDLSRNLTFVVGGANLIATEGSIRVDSVTSTMVLGGLHAIYDGDNEVDGSFEIAICPAE